MSEAVPREDLPDRRSTVAGNAEGASTRRSGDRKAAAATSQATSASVGPAAAPAATATVRGTVRKRFDVDDFFGRQPCSSQDLPPSGPLLENLTRCVIEILAGARELDQIARWVSDDVYRHLLKRVVLSARARRTKGQSVTRPVFTIGTVTSFSPRDGVIEAVIVVHGRARARAVAIRLEGLDRRWRATAINVL
ncbi:hypothetical protein ITJ40_05175 [Clavibacter sp. VKM Ac-2872]|nr:Rv3235 family protein [Clavibacter sp. VKM Ac-2872]MBF4623639.1 hypothetical protein [Clavibacter sp. VKM Ac-2872]